MRIFFPITAAAGLIILTATLTTQHMAAVEPDTPKSGRFGQRQGLRNGQRKCRYVVPVRRCQRFQMSDGGADRDCH
jgi:hypothetical protein